MLLGGIQVVSAHVEQVQKCIVADPAVGVVEGSHACLLPLAWPLSLRHCHVGCVDTA